MSLLIFDLDGTLIDSRLDLVGAVNATRNYMGREPLANDTVYQYVGNGALVLIQRAMGPEMSPEEVERAHDFFIEYYRGHALDATVLYPGVKEALERLQKAKHSLAILTNKPVRISKLVASGLGIGDYFFEIYGGNSFDYKKPNPIGIDTLCSTADIPKQDTWMVGDSAVDIQTARNAGVRACGLTYGFQPESLKEFPPDILFDRFDEFTDYVLSRG